MSILLVAGRHSLLSGLTLKERIRIAERVLCEYAREDRNSRKGPSVAPFLEAVDFFRECPGREDTGKPGSFTGE